MSDFVSDFILSAPDLKQKGIKTLCVGCLGTDKPLGEIFCPDCGSCVVLITQPTPELAEEIYRAIKADPQRVEALRREYHWKRDDIVPMKEPQ